MKTKTVILISALLVVVNSILAVTIYFLVKPEAMDTLMAKLQQVEVPELPEIELTEDDVDAVKENVKTKIYERAQLTEDGVPSAAASDLDEEDAENMFEVEQWGLTFHFPEKASKYNVKMSKDVLTIERHLEVLAYIARYDVGVKPSIEGHWELLATYKDSDFYMRKGDSLAGKETNSRIEREREALYESILKTYHFNQES